MLKKVRTPHSAAASARAACLASRACWPTARAEWIERTKVLSKNVKVIDALVHAKFETGGKMT